MNIAQLAESISPAAEGTVQREQAIQATQHRAEILAEMDPDERLKSMEAEPWNFTTDHLRQVNRVTQEFLNNPARRRLRETAARCLQEGEPPYEIASQWFTEEEFNRLNQLINGTEIPDRLLVLCYVWLEVHEISQAAYLIAKQRETPGPDVAGFTQTPDERAEDLRFTNAT
jgi:hypothetical protein